MKDLIIDIGNTRVKVAVFEDSKIVETFTCAYDELRGKIEKKMNREEFHGRLFSSVGDRDGKLSNFLVSEFGFVPLTREMKMPFKNCYASPETLGLDRYALVSAAVKMYENQDVLVIDAGTCVTYDFVNKNSDYLGGAISPGLVMRYKAMNKFTAKLPLLKSELPQKYIGSTTKECMQIGAEFGLIFEIDSMISQYKLEYPNLIVLLTGGDTFHLASQLKNSIFAIPNLILEGMESIMTNNTL